MVDRTNKRSSIYGDYIEGQVRLIAEEGGRVMNFIRFAETLGLKPTHNLRKRLRSMEALGLLSISYGYKGNYTTQLLYEVFPSEEHKRKMEAFYNDIPF